MPNNPRSRLSPLTEVRAYRLRFAVPLVQAAYHAGLSLSRASEIERFPDRARPGELKRLRGGVDAAMISAPPTPDPR
jgi:hypothetical protein